MQVAGEGVCSLAKGRLCATVNNVQLMQVGDRKTILVTWLLRIRQAGVIWCALVGSV